MRNSKLSKKLNKFKASPLIMVVAIIEVIILIGVSTFAWFSLTDNTTITSDLLSVEPDSGLDIDFNVADDKSFVDINKYISNFEFEPVTSLDGRNIFVPTTGTKNNVETNSMKFREATVNDMNSKYVNVDFTLTNTGENPVEVSLHSDSYFKVNDNARDGKALRLALYSNDGSSGQVTSEMLDGSNAGTVPGEGEGDDPSQGDGNQGGKYTVYLDAPSDWTEKDQIKAHVWGDSDVGSLTGFPGETMTYDSATGYYTYSADYKYYKILFSYKGNQNQTVNLDVYDGGVYVLEEGRNGTWALENITLNGGTKVEGGGSGSGEGNNPTDTPTTGSTDYVTVYFYNQCGWKEPQAFIFKETGETDEVPDGCSWPGVKLTHIAGDLYYHTFEKKYDYIVFNDGKASTNTPREQTEDALVQAGKIYYPMEDDKYTRNGVTYYPVDTEDYLSSYDGGTYPVISPGVSAGFKRPYAPVLDINNQSGKAGTVIPAFASSIEEYSYGSGKTLFTIAKGQTINLSMIIWLEGTDTDCTGSNYLGKEIDLELIFATKEFPEDLYNYRFLDRTKERWLNSSLKSPTGVPFKPVMQLYDNDNNKGYLMHEVKDADGNVIEWTLTATDNLLSNNLSFRRVNPMNEDEIWNYWDAGKISYNGAYSDEDSDGTNDTVTFSAFADGAPTTTNSGAPSRSCGGLWGEYETKILTVYDGTKDQYIFNTVDSKPGDDKSQGALTINYTYNGQTIEYKGSAQNSIYYFVVPTEIYSLSTSSRPSMSFKRYYNYNTSYAINSDKNKLYYDKKWSLGKCNGEFAQLMHEGDSWYGYWGKDIVYVQVVDLLKNTFILGDGSGNTRYHIQAHFYTGNTTSSKDHYVHLYNNYSYKGDFSLGYVCVIPNDQAYSNYSVELCGAYKDGARNIISKTGLQPISDNKVGNNTLIINNAEGRVYLKVHSNFSGFEKDPSMDPKPTNSSSAIMLHHSTETIDKNTYNVYHGNYNYGNDHDVWFWCDYNNNRIYNHNANIPYLYTVYTVDSTNNIKRTSDFLDENCELTLWTQSVNTSKWD